MNVLFICTGNLCRSVMAERLLDKMGKERGLDVRVKSCGTGAESCFTPPDPVWRELAKRGVERRPHVPQLIDRNILRWADIALAMTREQETSVKASFPEFTSKIHLLRSWAGLDDEDIRDPMGEADSAYATAGARIREALDAILRIAPFKP